MEGRDEGTGAPSMTEAAFNISSITALMCSRVSSSNAKAWLVAPPARTEVGLRAALIAVLCQRANCIPV